MPGPCVCVCVDYRQPRDLPSKTRKRLSIHSPFVAPMFDDAFLRSILPFPESAVKTGLRLKKKKATLVLLRAASVMMPAVQQTAFVSLLPERSVGAPALLPLKEDLFQHRKWRK